MQAVIEESYVLFNVIARTWPNLSHQSLPTELTWKSMKHLREITSTGNLGKNIIVKNVLLIRV